MATHFRKCQACFRWRWCGCDYPVNHSSWMPIHLECITHRAYAHLRRHRVRGARFRAQWRANVRAWTPAGVLAQAPVHAPEWVESQDGPYDVRGDPEGLSSVEVDSLYR